MLLDRYFETIDKLYAKIRETQRGNVLQAGRLIAKSVQNGACVHIFDTGHIINSELVERGGGLMLYKPFKYSLNVEDPVRPRDRSHINTSGGACRICAARVRCAARRCYDYRLRFRKNHERDRSGDRSKKIRA